MNQPVPDWLLNSLRLIPVSVRGSEVKLMSANEAVLVSVRLSQGKCWHCGKTLDEPSDEDSGLCFDCLEREAA